MRTREDEASDDGILFFHVAAYDIDVYVIDLETMGNLHLLENYMVQLHNKDHDASFMNWSTKVLDHILGHLDKCIVDMKYTGDAISFEVATAFLFILMMSSTIKTSKNATKINTILDKLAITQSFDKVFVDSKYLGEGKIFTKETIGKVLKTFEFDKGFMHMSVESPDADIKAAYEGVSANERSAFLVKVGDQERRRLVSLGLDVSKAPTQPGNDPFPQHPSSNQIARGPDEVTASLAALGLDRYAPAFRELGYDNLDYLKSSSQEELLRVAKSVQMLEGHAVRWVRSLGGSTAASLETVALARPAPGAAGQVRVLPAQAPPVDDEGGRGAQGGRRGAQG